MTELTALFNGESVPESRYLIHATDRGFRVGDVVCYVQRMFTARVFRPHA